VPDDIEAIETKPSHHLDQIERHRALRIGQVPGVGGRLTAGAITAQVGRDDREALGEARRDLVPHHMTQRIAVNEEQRRAVAALLESDLRTRGLDALVREAFEHPRLAGPYNQADLCYALNSSSNALASFKSAVSKPSVNHP